MAKKFLQYIIATLAMMVAIPAFAGGPPKVVEIRALCESGAVKAMRDARSHRTNLVSWQWDGSQAAKANVTGIVFAPGLTADVRIEGVALPSDRVYGIVPRDPRKPSTTVRASKIGADYVEFHGLDLGDGAIDIVLGEAKWQSAKGFPLVTVTPKGWKGVGYSWNEAKSHFQASYAHRLDNGSIMPEIVAVCTK